MKPPEAKTAPACAFEAEPLDVTKDWQGPAPDGAATASATLTASDGTGLRLKALETRAVVVGPLAYTEVHLTFANDEQREREGTFTIHLPESATVSRFAMRLPMGWQEAEVVESRKAQVTFESFEHKQVDPAILEKTAGNTFRGRVYPIFAGSEKEIVISYSEELATADAPYRFPLRGLPKADLVDVQLLYPHKKQAFVLHREAWQPDRDFEIASDASAPSAVRAGRFAVFRVATPPRQPAAPVDSVAIAIDTSASRRADYEASIARTRELVASLGASSVRLATFDQSVVPAASLDEVAGRAPGGASDLGAALGWLEKSGAKRAILVTDGHATAGETDPAELRKLTHNLERLDAIVVGASRDEALLSALVSGARAPGVALDGAPPAAEIARAFARPPPREVNVAVPSSTFVAVDGGLVYAELTAENTPLEASLDGAPAASVDAAPALDALVARAVIHAKIRALVARQAAPGTSGGQRESLRQEIVDLSTRSRVLSPFTAMLVLEQRSDFARLQIPSTGLSNLITVGPTGLELARRDGPVFWDRPSDNGPLIDDTRAARDQDGDGIPDIEDACPDAPENFQGIDDEDGCPDVRRVLIQADRLVILERVRFEGKSARIASTSFNLLDAIADVMREHPEILLVTIEGHTDSSGDEAANRKLSGERAEAVKRALVERGVDAVRLTTVAYGETRPIMPNDTEEGREANRRVDFRVERLGDPSEITPSELFRRGDAIKATPTEQPVRGRMLEVEQALAKADASAALELADQWTRDEPENLSAHVARGRALEALSRFDDAARAYGSVLDLATKPEHRSVAADRLAALGARSPRALDLAVSAYQQALRERPDRPSTHLLLAHTLARAGRLDEALAVLLSALERTFDQRVFRGARGVLAREASVLAAAVLRAAPASKAEEVKTKLAARGLEAATNPSVEIALTWATDGSDLDLKLVAENAKESKLAYSDVSDGFGPEVIAFSGPRPKKSKLVVHQVTKGPGGAAFGVVTVVVHDGKGGLTFESRPFLLEEDHAAVDLGALE
ncbi:MAG: OmpA family protein [Polyangiaceae bacterium]